MLGQNIGVFSVFDTQPREEFPNSSRRTLMDMARLTMTEFELLIEEHQMNSRASSTVVARPSSSMSTIIHPQTGPAGDLQAKFMRVIEEDAQIIEEQRKLKSTSR